jgi:hypothetical protein
MNRLLPFLFASAALVLATAASAENLVVVEARGVALKPGAAVDSTKPLVLKPGQHVTLISSSGTTLNLDGPYDRAPTIGGGGSASNTFAALVTERLARTSELGTTRGTTVAKLPGPWLIDASRGGSACLAEGTQAVFWRPSATAAVKLAVLPDDRSWKIETEWPAGTDRITVRDLALVHSEATYFVNFGGTESAIRVNVVPAALANDAMRAAWMANKGCEAQAEALARNSR